MQEEWRSHNARLPGHIAKSIDAVSVLRGAGRFAQQLASSDSNAEASGNLLGETELQKVRQLIDAMHERESELDDLHKKCRSFRQMADEMMDGARNPLAVTENADSTRRFLTVARDTALAVEAYSTRESSLVLKQVGELTGLTREMNGVPASASAVICALNLISAEVNSAGKEIEDRVSDMASFRATFDKLLGTNERSQFPDAPEGNRKG
jgi:hypothetical protein